MRKHKDVKALVDLVENGLGGKNRPTKVIWEDLLRPCLGELVLLRSFRSGWRAHLNPLAFDPNGPQARISSNFVSLRGLKLAEENEKDRDTKDMARVILAFLVSSFGQIQFEYFGQNREGLRKGKGTCIDNVCAPTPQPSATRNSVDDRHFESVSCPVSCESHPHADPKRRELDKVVAAHILNCDSQDLQVLELVDTVALELDELQRERLG